MCGPQACEREVTMTASTDFTDLTSPFRGELLAHCYRMLGSVDEAEDLVQETYLRAWRSFGGFEGRSSVRTWLYRIATNACLTALERRGRRPLPSGLAGPAADPDIALVPAPEVPWLQPVPDALLAGPGEDPASAVAARAGIRLALVAAQQYLPARQRAMLILRDVLGWPAAEVAGLLGTTTTAVNSGLRRARAQLARALPAEEDTAEPNDPGQRAALDRFAAAFENADADALAELLRKDAVLEMPPLPGWFAGRDAIRAFFAAQVLTEPGMFRLVRDGGQRAAGLRGLPARRRRGVPGARGAGPGALPHRDRAGRHLPRARVVRPVRAAGGRPNGLAQWARACLPDQGRPPARVSRARDRPCRRGAPARSRRRCGPPASSMSSGRTPLPATSSAASTPSGASAWTRPARPLP